jgi:hypothetical protein
MLTAALLLLFAAVAALDGVWIHLCQLQLHARPASWVEHVWHTVSAVLFVPIVAILFVRPSGGALLWLAMALLLATHVVEVLDVRAERESRRDLGGLSRFELGVHVAAVASRTAAILALLVQRPAAIWWSDRAATELPAAVVSAGEMVLGGSVLVATLHVVLAVLYCPCRRPQLAAPP